MADPLFTIAGTLRAAFAEATGLPAESIDPVVRPSDRADAQANGALALAKQLGKNPREVATAAVATGLLAEACSTVEVAGPGFINLTFKPTFLATQLAEAAADPRLGVRSVVQQRTVVVDYSHPNVAKEMHVGHLRTTMIGDSLVRLLRFVGYRDDQEGPIWKLVEKWQVAIPLHPEYGLGPNVFYVPPMSPPKLDEQGRETTEPRIPLAYLESLFGPAVQPALDVLLAERAKTKRGETSELMDLLIAYNWQDNFKLAPQHREVLT